MGKQLEVKRFNADKHEEDVMSWLRKRDVDITSLPKIGGIVEGLAVGFLSLTDGDTAFLTGGVTNPDADKQERRQALNIIGQKLVSVAKEMGYKYIRYDIRGGSIEDIMASLGFKCAGTFKTYLKEI